MQLKKVKICEFQSIRDSREFEVSDITCLVGKNESGKTALLKALYRLNPINAQDGQYSVTDDFPRWDVEDYRLAVESGKRPPATVASALFALEKGDEDAVLELVGDGVMTTASLTLSKGYDNKLRPHLTVSVPKLLNNLATTHNLASDIASVLGSLNEIPKALEFLNASEKTENVSKVIALLNPIKESGGLEQFVYEKALAARVPKFLYFDEYYQMEGSANVEALQQRLQKKDLKLSDYPLLGLINRARLKLEELRNPERTRDLKNRLEGAGNHITKQIVKYWSQNRYSRWDSTFALECPKTRQE